MSAPVHDAGTALPELKIPVTALLIVAGAIATRDFNLVHHDHAAAKAAGAEDIFMNILSTNTLVGRYIGEWAGPTARISDISIRLGATNYPGDELTFTGEVESVDADGAAVVAVRGTNSVGTHVSGTVRLHWEEAAS